QKEHRLPFSSVFVALNLTSFCNLAFKHSQRSFTQNSSQSPKLLQRDFENDRKLTSNTST
ncbi:MAG: hypothetical protein ABSD71_00210, partial [Bacteroidales bacterium]